MKEINFYDKERKLIMQFKKFQFSKDSELNIVCFYIKVDTEYFHLEDNFNAEIYDYKDFLSSLQLMHQEKCKFANFNPFLSEIMIRFSLRETGLIVVENQISNDLSKYNFEFEYEIDQSFLPELIREIELAMQDDVLKNYE